MKKFLLTLLLAVMSVAAGMAKSPLYKQLSATGTDLMTIAVERIDAVDGGIRLYATLTGRPHTSNRIDTLMIVTPEGKTVSANDIDGVDMKRWFQWEDSGAIDVEIDFPVRKVPSKFTLKATGPKGDVEAKFVKKK